MKTVDELALAAGLCYDHFGATIWNVADVKKLTALCEAYHAQELAKTKGNQCE